LLETELDPSVTSEISLEYWLLISRSNVELCDFSELPLLEPERLSDIFDVPDAELDPLEFVSNTSSALPELELPEEWATLCD
jgi:hypothetical protein